jgi:hypothetical protein
VGKQARANAAHKAKVRAEYDALYRANGREAFKLGLPRRHPAEGIKDPDWPLLEAMEYWYEQYDAAANEGGA